MSGEWYSDALAVMPKERGPLRCSNGDQVPGMEEQPQWEAIQNPKIKATPRDLAKPKELSGKEVVLGAIAHNPKVRPCVKCEVVRRIQARGLCMSCYSHENKAGRLHEWPTLSP